MRIDPLPVILSKAKNRLLFWMMLGIKDESWWGLNRMTGEARHNAGDPSLRSG
jgi:hypothetical protein